MAILNNGLKTIELGSINWRILFNDNMQKLDISVIQYVLYADLPNTFVGDRMFFVKDKGKFYYDDGTQLLEVIGGMVKGLDADKLTNTEDTDLYYATDTNIIYYNDNGTIVQVTGSADLTAIDSDILPDTDDVYNIGSTSYRWHSCYFNYLTVNSDISVGPNSECSISSASSIGYIRAKNALIFSGNNNNSFAVNNYGQVQFYQDITQARNIIPYDELRNLGSSSKRWYNFYIKNNIFNDGWTRSGDLAPAIKTKKITGTTGANQGDTVSVVHNLTGGKIISYTLKIETSADNGVGSEHSFNSGFQASINHDNTNFNVYNSALNSSNILSKNFIIYLTYEI